MPTHSAILDCLELRHVFYCNAVVITVSEQYPMPHHGKPKSGCQQRVFFISDLRQIILIHQMSPIRDYQWADEKNPYDNTERDNAECPISKVVARLPENGPNPPDH